MIKFENYTDLDIQEYLTENKVCIVTNTVSQLPGSLFFKSLKTYVQFIPNNNFMVIPGIKDGKPWYGVNAFIDMVNTLLNYDFNYIIYIDEDCFIKDFRKLLVEFEKFKDGNYCLGGLQDGGMICHRNQSRFLINTFLSFWNLALIKNKKEKFTTILTSFIKAASPYKSFIDGLKSYKEGKLYNIMNDLSLIMLDKGREYRRIKFEGDEPPHAAVVRNDPNNQYEPNQIPYSYKDIVEQNMEPYYLIEEAFVYATKRPIYYMFGSDFYTNKDTGIETSGITTVIMNENCKHIAYHTWFARYYKPNVQDELIQKHVKRIDSVINSLK